MSWDWNLFVIIGKHVDDPKTWTKLNLTCKRIYNMLKEFTPLKKDQFKKRISGHLKWTEVLPNGLLHGFHVWVAESFDIILGKFTPCTDIYVQCFDSGYCVGCYNRPISFRSIGDIENETIQNFDASWTYKVGRHRYSSYNSKCIDSKEHKKSPCMFDGGQIKYNTSYHIKRCNRKGEGM